MPFLFVWTAVLSIPLIMSTGVIGLVQYMGYSVLGMMVLGWGYVYYAATLQPILLSLGWLAIGVIAFLVWARLEHIWPFGPKEIHEAYLEKTE